MRENHGKVHDFDHVKMAIKSSALFDGLVPQPKAWEMNGVKIEVLKLLNWLG